jgi:non-homologous end joining protein Ku
VVKYNAVTGSSVKTVERKELIESYQVGNDVYIMLTTSNVVKFKQKESKERETMDNIVSSFRIGQGASL